MSLRFCDEVCRALYHRAAKHNKAMQRFALLASAQVRCGFCGENVDRKKRIKLVEIVKGRIT